MKIIFFWGLKIIVPAILLGLVAFLLPILFFYLYYIFYIIKLIIAYFIIKFIPEGEKVVSFAKIAIPGLLPPKKSLLFIEALQKDFFSRVVGSNTADILSETSKKLHGERLEKTYETIVRSFVESLYGKLNDKEVKDNNINEMVMNLLSVLKKKDGQEVIEKLIKRLGESKRSNENRS